ncbi:MAG: DUF29 family protein [Alphaproteobacteria bacterium]|jgi:hypothetical protein|nr:DUF29 family protein [Alphaproteobacteria bacterium]
MPALYETDVYAWAKEQANLLREGNVAAADLAHIAEGSCPATCSWPFDRIMDETYWPN